MDREELIKNVKDLHEEIFEKLDDATTVFADKLNANCRLIFSYNDRRKVEESMGNTVDDIESSILTNDNRQYFEEAEVNSLDEIQYDIETLEGYDDVDSFLKDKRDGILDCYTIEF